MSKDEDNQNFPISQVLRRIEELGWDVTIYNSEESNGWAIINLTKGSQGFALWIQDYGTNEDAKEGSAKGIMGYPFVAVFGRFLVRSYNDVDFNCFFAFL
jgi:hypothetical protein